MKFIRFRYPLASRANRARMKFRLAGLETGILTLRRPAIRTSRICWRTHRASAVALGGFGRRTPTSRRFQREVATNQNRNEP